jgi:hypothetical protein
MTIQVGNVTTAASNVYVSSGNSAITFLSLCNYSAGNVTANVYIVPSGSSASNSTVAMSNLNITSHDTYQFYAAAEKLLLGSGDTIQVSCSANNAITTITSYTSI